MRREVVVAVGEREVYVGLEESTHELKEGRGQYLDLRRRCGDGVESRERDK